MKNTFCKEERLYSKILIDELFSNPDDRIKLTEFPFVLIAKKVTLSTSFPAQVLFSVSKKKVKLATKRNQIKRKCKEAYRQNKHSFYNQLNSKGENLILAFIYLGNKPLPYELIEEKIIVLLSRLTEG